jgi:hypothetical protein
VFFRSLLFLLCPLLFTPVLRDQKLRSTALQSGSQTRIAVFAYAVDGLFNIPPDRKAISVSAVTTNQSSDNNQCVATRTADNWNNDNPLVETTERCARVLKP